MQVSQRFVNFSERLISFNDNKCINCKKFYGTKNTLFMCSLCYYKFKEIIPPSYVLDFDKYWKENNFKIFPEDIFGDIVKSLTANSNINVLSGTQLSYKIHNIIRIINTIPILPSDITVIKCEEDCEETEEICSICYSNMRNIRFIPCGHNIMCSECYVKSDSYECPLCRGDIDDITKYNKDNKDFDIENYKPQKVMFSDEQANKLIKLIKWEYKMDGFRVSHAITRWKITPWSTSERKVYHPSSFCYYGNHGEQPISKLQLDRVYEHNLSNFADV